jgi:sodium/proline symporter
MAADDLRTIPKARRIGMAWMILCLAGAMAVGFFGIAYFAGHPGGAVVDANPERVFIVLANLLFNPWVAGVLLSAILAAIMSTLSCQLLVCSSALTEDFYKGFVRPRAGQGELVWFGRAMVLAVALLAIWIARDPDSRVLGLVSYAWAGFGAAFGPVVLFSLFWERMTRNGALAGMVAGAVTVILWKQVAVDQYGSALYEMVPGFAAASVAIVVASLLDRVPVESVRATHAQVHAALAENGY